MSRDLNIQKKLLNEYLLRIIKLCVGLVRVEREQKAGSLPALDFRLVHIRVTRPRVDPGSNCILKTMPRTLCTFDNEPGGGVEGTVSESIIGKRHFTAFHCVKMLIFPSNRL